MRTDMCLLWYFPFLQVYGFSWIVFAVLIVLFKVWFQLLWFISKLLVSNSNVKFLCMDSTGIHLQSEDISQFSVGAAICPRTCISIGTGWCSCCCCDYISLHQWYICLYLGFSAHWMGDSFGKFSLIMSWLNDWVRLFNNLGEITHSLRASDSYWLACMLGDHVTG